MIRGLYMLKHAEEYDYWYSLDDKYSKIIFEKVAAKTPKNLFQNVVGGFRDMGDWASKGKAQWTKGLNARATARKINPKNKDAMGDFKSDVNKRMYGAAAAGLGTIGAVGGAGYLLGKD